MNAPDDLYDSFSPIKLTIDKLTNFKSKTMEKAPSIAVEKQNFTKLFTNKNEYIIDNDFARKLKWSIEDFRDMMYKRELS